MTSKRKGIRRLVPGDLLGDLMHAKDDLWQMDLLDASEFSRFVRDRDLRVGRTRDELYFLWRLGLLRADFVRSRRKLRWRGLKLLEQDQRGRYLYSDPRETPWRKSGWVDVGLGRRIQIRFPKYLELRFHPFRLYVVYHLDRVFGDLSVSPLQFIIGTKWIDSRLDWKIRMLRSGTRAEHFGAALKRWHDTTDLSILIEPCVAEKLLGKLRIHSWDLRNGGFNRLRKEINRHWERVHNLLKEIGLEQLEELRGDLCSAAEILDPNKTLHVLLRLNQRTWLRWKGNLGASMYLLAMAESIRRAAESTFSIELPEEDEKGFGLYPKDYKLELYGGPRIIDGSMAVRAEFVRNHGLDFRLRARCYVEGATEYGALRYVFASWGWVELINLRGDFGKTGNRRGGLRSQLERDQKESVFSFLFLDGDRSDPLRIVRRAAEDGVFFGEFYVARPDFEFANFTAEELLGILRHLSEELGIGTGALDRAVRAGSTPVSGKDIERLAQSTNQRLADGVKGFEWGERLMKYAIKHQYLGEDLRRPLLEQIDRVWTAHRADYKASRRTQSLNLETGFLQSE